MCNSIGLRKRCIILVIAVLSLATAYCVQYAVPQDARLYYTMNASPLLVAILLFFLYRKGYTDLRKEAAKNKLEFALTSVLGLIISGFIIEGAQLQGGGFFVPVAAPLLASIVLCSFPITIALLLVWHSSSLKKSASFSTAADFRWTLCVFSILLLCWLPWYFGAFPGLFCYNMGETNGEWGQYISGNITTHFPVFHTVLSGMIVDFGRNFLGDGVDINSGVALLTALQCLVIAAIFTFCVCWMRKHGAKCIIVYGAIVYFALNPVTSIFIMCTTRDTLFSAVALLVALFSYDVLDASRKGKPFGALTGLAVSCIILCLLRNNGFYSFVLLAIVLVILGRQKALILSTCALVFIFSAFWFGPLYESMGVEKEENQQKEALALPIQQLAYVSSSGKLTDDEVMLLLSLRYAFPSEEDYFPKISDPAKFTIADMDLRDLVGAYVLVGINHPVDYMYAELARTEDLWSPYSYINCYNGFIDKVAGKETSFFSTTINSPGSAQSLIPGLLEFMHRLGGELFFQSIPLASLLVSVPFYFVVMLIILFRTAMIRNRMMFGAMFVFAALAIGSCFGPCILPRYFIYLFFGFPLMVFFLQGKSMQIEWGIAH